MFERSSSFDVGAWPARVWATALAAGAVVFLLVLMLGAHWLLALLLGVAAFLAAAWQLRRGAARLLTTPSVVEEGHGAPAHVPPAEAAPEPAPAAAAFVAAPAVVAPAAPPGPSRPAGLEGPRDGRADDLKRIKGVGPKLEGLLNSLGYYHFDQIAGWSEVEIAWVDSNLEGFNGRVTREDWVGQARILVAGGETEHSRQVDRGEFD